ncbi:MAG: bifunctional metallophosphatase/5'-nucleotidase [Elusimicrobia bacterium]|nr:bifunctional metallophosphatase/5'-nucleotidase [Elusimicrobiota bacterium]
MSKKQRAWNQRSSPAVAAAFISICLFSSGVFADQTLVIYHTNDIHGYISAREATFHKENPKRLIGGFAALAAVVKKEKHPRLLLDSGDLFFASPEGNLTMGESVVTLANALGFAAGAIGNHEFDMGEKRLGEIAKKVKFPLLGANILNRLSKKSGPSAAAAAAAAAAAGETRAAPQERPEYATPYVIRDVAGLKVGLIGLITPATPTVTLPKHVRKLKFPRPVNVAKDLVAELKKQGCDLVIVLSHIGWAKAGEEFEDDKYLAKNVPGIDVILGGHSHTRLERAYQDESHKTIIIQSGSYLSAVGRLELTLDGGKKIKRFDHRLIDLWIDQVGEDPEILTIAKPYKDKVDAKLAAVVGEAKSDLFPNRDGESVLGNAIADAMRLRAKADIAMQNPGGIRSPIPAGAITLRQVYATLPFDNTIVTMELTGGQIKEIVEATLADDKGKMQISGLRLRYDPRRPKGHRLTDLRIDGKPILVTKSYLVATNSFLADGGDGYGTFLRGENKKDSGVLLRDAFVEYVRMKSPVAPGMDGRIASE